MDGSHYVYYYDTDGAYKKLQSTHYVFNTGDHYATSDGVTLASATKGLFSQISPLQKNLREALTEVNAKKMQIESLNIDINNLKAKNEQQVAELNGKLLAMAQSNKNEVVEATSGTATTTRKFTLVYLAVALIALYFLKTA